MADFSKIKEKDKIDYHTEYNMIKSQVGADGDANAMILSFKSGKSPLKLMKMLGIVMMVFGLPLSIILIGLLPFCAGLFFFFKAKKLERKFDYLIHLSKTDPDLSMTPASNTHPAMQQSARQVN